MACIIYYANLDYDLLPTARKKRRLSGSPSTGPPQPVPRYLPTQSTICLSSAEPSASNSPKTLSSSSSVSSAATHLYWQPSQSPPPNNSYNTSMSTNNYGYNSRNYEPTNHNAPPRPAFVEQRRQPAAPLSACQNFATKKPVDHAQLLSTLKRYFKFSSFRENQLEAVNATCQGLDALVLMPTGGGKSICYQLPAILTEGLTIVVSPLKSLIDDQVTRLRSLGIKTSALSGNTPEREVSDVYHDLKQPHPEHKLLYVTPEKITLSPALINIFSDLYSRGLLARFVIDEAHCVSTWGADFRPDYRKLGRLRELYEHVPIMALTATAPPQVRDDIFNQLKMDKQTGKTFIQSFNRPNLKFEVRTKSKGCIVEICNLIEKKFSGQCGIIYCLSRNDCESVAEKLRDNGIMSAPYHAGLSDNQRKKVFKAWSTSVFQVVCATIAFGMGIDKSDVRFVIHYSVPKSVEGYYQEAGRAGRDGDFASCILYFSKSDVYRMKSMLSKGFGRASDDKKRDQSNLDHIINYVENKTQCRRAILLRYLGEEFDSNDCISHIKTACDNCLAR